MRQLTTDEAIMIVLSILFIAVAIVADSALRHCTQMSCDAIQKGYVQQAVLRPDGRSEIIWVLPSTPTEVPVSLEIHK